MSKHLGREIKDEAKTVDKLEDEPAHGKGVRVVIIIEETNDEIRSCIQGVKVVTLGRQN